MNLKGLELLETFIVVAEELNFRRSAERMNIDQSAFTRRIQKLETLLGFSLLERTTRLVTLTPAGRSLYESSAKLMEVFENGVARAQRISDGKAGMLRIGYMAFAATTLMPHAVSEYKRKNPHVDVTLNYMGTQNQKIALASDEIDLGYIIGPFDHSEYDSLLLTSDPLFVVMPRSHPLSLKSEIQPSDIKNYSLIFGSPVEWEVYYWHVENMFRENGIQIKTTIEAPSTMALIGLVAAGMGITIYPKSIIGFLGGSVDARPISCPGFKIDTILAWKRINRVQSALDFIKEAKRLIKDRTHV